MGSNMGLGFNMGVSIITTTCHDGSISCYIHAWACSFPVDGAQHGTGLQHGTWLSSSESISPWTWWRLQHFQWNESQCGTKVALRRAGLCQLSSGGGEGVRGQDHRRLQEVC